MPPRPAEADRSLDSDPGRCAVPGGGPEQRAGGPEQRTGGPEQWTGGPEQWTGGPEQWIGGPAPFIRIFASLGVNASLRLQDTGHTLRDVPENLINHCV